MAGRYVQLMNALKAGTPRARGTIKRFMAPESAWRPRRRLPAARIGTGGTVRPASLVMRWETVPQAVSGMATRPPWTDPPRPPARKGPQGR